MQRLFSMFPSGGPGVGLAVLRVSLAGALVVGVSAPTSTAAYAWTAAAVAALLFAGALTPIAAVLGGLLGAAHLLSKAGPLFGGLPLAHAVFYLGQAGALALLGPGAYSVDALRFGRRRVSARRSRLDDLR